MADNKAFIMITVNSIILISSYLFSLLENLCKVPHLIWPTMLLLGV